MSFSKVLPMGLVAISIAFGIHGHSKLLDLPALDVVYKTFQLFGLEGDYAREIPWTLNLARFMAPLSILGVFLQIFTLGIEQLAFLLRTIFKKNINVFFGEGKYTEVIRSELESKRTVILFTSASPHPQSFYTYRFLYQKGKKSFLLSWSLKRAENIYIEEMKSPDLYYLLNLFEHYLKDRKVKIHIHTTTPEQTEYVENFSQIYRKNLNIACFNLIHQSSFIFTQKFQPSALSQQNVLNPCDVHIIGFGDFMKSFFQKLFTTGLQVTDEQIKYKIYSMREDATNARNTIELQGLPEFDLLENVAIEEFTEYRYFSSVREDCSNDTFIYIGLNRPAETIHLAEKMMEFFKGKAHIHLILCFSDLNEEDDLFIESSVAQLRQVNQMGPKFYDYLIFGEDSFVEDFKDFQERLDKEAMEINRKYCEAHNISDTNLTDWTLLKPERKNSNRLAALSAQNYRALYAKLKESIQDEKAILELLSKTEHDRWMRERRISGFKLGNKNCSFKREHPCLIPYPELSEDNKEKDRNNIRGFIHELA
jgi:hypothetical protein